MGEQRQLSRTSKVVLILTIIECLVIISLEATVAGVLWKYYDPLSVEGPSRGVPVYLVIFVVAQLFQIYMCVDAIHNQNTIQILVFVFFNLLICSYSIFQYFQMDDLIFDDEQQILAHVEISDRDKRTLQGALISIPVITGLFTIAFAWGAKVLYSEFGWKIYKKIGADPAMRDMYRAYQIFLLLIKLDFFFMFSFGLQFLVLVIKKTDPEFALTIAALPTMLGVVVLAVWGLRRESKPIMILFSIGVLAAIAYFIFKLVRIHTRQDQEGYRDSKYYLSFFAALSLGTACLTLICAATCYNNFGKGLRQHLMSNRVRRQVDHTEPVVVIDEETNHPRKPMVDD